MGIPGIVSVVYKQKKKIGESLTSQEIVKIGQQLWKHRDNPALKAAINSKKISREQININYKDDDEYLVDIQSIKSKKNNNKNNTQSHQQQSNDLVTPVKKYFINSSYNKSYLSENKTKNKRSKENNQTVMIAIDIV